MHKHNKAPQWQVIGYKTQKRKRAGKESEIYLDGKNISKKARREVSRHYFPSAQEQYGQGNDAEIPDVYSY